MRTRSLVAVAVIAPLLAGVGTAHAAKKPPAKKPVCKLVTDSANDGTGTGTGQTGPNDPNLDIVSADIATNAATLTAVWRLSAVDGSNSSSPTGRSYTMTFTVNDKTTTVRAIISPAGNVWQGGDGTGFVDTKLKEIHLSVPLAKLVIPVKANDKVGSLGASAWRWVGNQSISLGLVDSAASVATYVAGWPSCVKVGA
jgi:hypothetical protein